MYQIYEFFDEESSNYDILGDFHTEINPNVNKIVKSQNNNETKSKTNELNSNNFEIEFNRIFNESRNFNTFALNEHAIYPRFDRQIFKQIKPIQEESIIKYDEKYFPFTKGIGLEKTLENLGYLVKFISPFEINLLPLGHEKKNINQTKFNIIDFSKNEKGKIKKRKKKRKFKPDDVRKKIKSKFHKSIKNIININLKQAGSKKLFDFFPQYFLSNITIKLNNIALSYTYEQLIKTDIATDVLKQKKSDTDKEKYNRNLDVCKYLESNQNISRMSLFDKLRNMRYLDILNAYFSSKEFEDSIIELHNKGEKIEYIEEYINKSLNYVYFFSTNGLYKQNQSNNEFAQEIRIEICGNGKNIL